MHNISYRGPMSEDDYIAVLLRIQQAMAIEPFQPRMIDVAKLLSDWRTLTDENGQLRRSLTLYEREIDQLRLSERLLREDAELGARRLLEAHALIDKHNDECRECPVIEVEHG